MEVSWIEEVVECTPTPLFLSNSNVVGMAKFVDLHKLVAQKFAFQPLQMHEMRMFQIWG
jgi:hypothetical protein